MANQTPDQPHPVRVFTAQDGPSTPEPPVRRWPHPVNGPVSVSIREADPAFHYIRCALSYQNQLLSEIKTLLEKLTVDQEEK